MTISPTKFSNFSTRLKLTRILSSLEAEPRMAKSASWGVSTIFCGELEFEFEFEFEFEILEFEVLELKSLFGDKVVGKGEDEDKDEDEGEVKSDGDGEDETNSTLPVSVPVPVSSIIGGLRSNLTRD